MPVRNPESIHDVDATELCDALLETLEGAPLSVVEFDQEGFNVLYADDLTLSFYDSEAAMYDHFEHIHGFVNLDYSEMNLFTDELFPVAEDVSFLASGMDLFTMVRVYVEDCAYFFALAPTEPILPAVRTVERVVEQG